MCIAQRSPWLREQIGADSTVAQPVLLLPWMLAHGADTLRITNELRALESGGVFTQAVRFRFAQVLTSQPGAWQTPGSPIERKANGADTADVDISGTTDQLWVQGALFANDTVGFGQSYSGFGAQLEGRARIVGARTIELNPDLNASAIANFPVGNVFPALGVSSLMWAVVVTGVSGTVTFRPVARLIHALDTEPGNWAAFAMSSSETGNALYNSGSVAVSPGTNAGVQVGLRVSAVERATLHVLVSAATS